MVLALCCHHRCDWQTYTGKEFFTDLGLSAHDFHLICSMTSWATCATRVFLDKLVERATYITNQNKAMDSKVKDVSQAQEKEGTEPERKRPKVDDKDSSETAIQESESSSHPQHEHESPSDENHYYHPRYGSLTPEQREEVGYQCKKLIDMGRLRYIKGHGFDARLVKYTTSELSLENIALLATRKMRWFRFNSLAFFFNINKIVKCRL